MSDGQSASRWTQPTAELPEPGPRDLRDEVLLLADPSYRESDGDEVEVGAVHQEAIFPAWLPLLLIVPQSAEVERAAAALVDEAQRRRNRARPFDVGEWRESEVQSFASFPLKSRMK